MSRAPGIYVKEVRTGPRPIEAIGTRTAAFVGRPPLDRHAGEAVEVPNWSRFRDRFLVGPNGDEAPYNDLAFAVRGFFENGGSRCYVVNSGDGSVEAALRPLELLDDVALVAAPGRSDYADTDALLTHCERRQDRFAVLDGPAEVRETSALVKDAAAAPAPRRARGGGEAEEGAEAPAAPAAAYRPPRSSAGGWGALYFPHLRLPDPRDPRATVVVPPSGHVAGVYARVDEERGVHKAPANEGLRGVVGLTQLVTDDQQGELNAAGVNVIRHFAREGVLVWGARTVDKQDPRWRYVPVRRLFTMVEESIRRSTRWVVFEPNDLMLWKSIRRDVSAFLLRLWRDGALMGATPDEAFFVQCDEETNPPESRDAGEVRIRVGIAPVKPAEFVIFEIGQHEISASSDEA